MSVKEITAEPEKILPEDPGKETFEIGSKVYSFQLFVTGKTPNSVRAVENLKRICESHFKDQYELKVIDLYLSPSQAKANNIIAAPTLLKVSPLPARRIIGDLSNEKHVVNSIRGYAYE